MHAVNLDKIDCHTRNGGEKYTSEAVTKGRAIAALERGKDEFAILSVRSQIFGNNFRLLNFFKHINPPIS